MRKHLRSVYVRRSAVVLLCLSLCLLLGSCSFSLEDTMVRLKAYINGTEVSEPPADFVESRENELFTYDVYETYVVLTGYLGEGKSVTVPKELDGLPVTTIGELAFYYGTAVENVVLPDSVTTLEENAFYYCRALKSIAMTDSVTSIGEKCFSWCSSLYAVRLPKSVTVIPDYCFNECAKLEVLVLPTALTSVGTRAFSGCTSLTSISFGDTLTSVGSLAFRDCTALESLHLPGGCEVGNELFVGCGEALRVTTARNSACWKALAEQGMREAEEDEGVSLRLPTEEEIAEASEPEDPEGAEGSEGSEGSEETESSGETP